MRNLLKKIPNTIIALIIFLVLVRLALPVMGLYGINWALENKMNEYTGRIEDFDLSLYRGAYQLQGLKIQKKNSNNPPLLTIDEIDLSLAWLALLRKEITADITVDALKLKLIDSKEKKDDQVNLAQEKGWQEALDVLIPMSIESLKLRRSSLEIENNSLKVPALVTLSKLNLNAYDLRNKKNKNKIPVSTFQAQALLQDHAELTIKGRVDILSQPLRLDANVELKNFELNTINEFLIAYLPLDVSKGKLSLYVETATEKGQVKGYVKAFLNEADIIDSEQKYLSFKHLRIEWPAAFVNWLLQNSKTKDFATSFPFEYTNSEFDFNGSKAFWSSLNNKFKALKHGIDEVLSLENFDEDLNKKP